MLRNLIKKSKKSLGRVSRFLANIDKITIVSTGDGHSAGMNKITGDMTQIAAQIPALFEALSGMQMSDLLGKVKTIKDRTPKPDKELGASAGTAKGD